MRYLSLDLETTCLAPAKPENILMLSMVVEDTANVMPLDMLPHLTFLIEHPVVTGTPYALHMNAWILEIIAGNREAQHPVFAHNQWVHVAINFLDKHFPSNKRITVAGKNVAGFDIPFLPELLRRRFSHRCIDPGSVFIDWEDEDIPSLDVIKSSLFIPGEVTHDAYDDALDVIKVLRTKYAAGL